MADATSADPIDRDCHIARSGKPHNPAIAHLPETHSLPATAGHLLEAAAAGRKDPDTRRILAALQEHRDADPESGTYGCYRWYVEDPAINDTNASFFICTPLVGLWLAHRDELTREELDELKAVFRAVLPWFRRMAESPSLYYPNKCISDAGMLLATGHILGDSEVIAAGRAFAGRYFEYYQRRGTGWGEDHSPVYVTVILEMTLLIMALEGDNPLAGQARALTDAILDWVAFHDGYDAVPSIRGYNFDAKIKVGYPVRFLIEGAPELKPRKMLGLLQQISGYRFTPPPLETPRQRRWRTFDDHFSTSYIGDHARLGSLSHYPLMPNTRMHDGWGLSWQSKPCSFIVGAEEYGILQWITEDDDGVIRQHEAGGKSIHDWASRHLFKRASFHPDMVFTGHQEGGAAIVFREIHRLHSPTRYLADRWRLAHSAGRVLIDGREWDGAPTDLDPQWVVLDYGRACVAVHPLQCRCLDAPDRDGNPQRRLRGNVTPVQLHLEKEDRGTFLSLPLMENHEGTIVQHLLFSGWCVVLLDRPEQVNTLSLSETLYEDGELPRTYGELIRRVDLSTPHGELTLIRDMLTGQVRRLVNGAAFCWDGDD
jgi:hypothetical protein